MYVLIYLFMHLLMCTYTVNFSDHLLTRRDRAILRRECRRNEADSGCTELCRKGQSRPEPNGFPESRGNSGPNMTRVYIYTWAYIHTYIHTYIHIYIYIIGYLCLCAFMGPRHGEVSELGLKSSLKREWEAQKQPSVPRNPNTP